MVTVAQDHATIKWRQAVDSGETILGFHEWCLAEQPYCRLHDIFNCPFAH